MLEWYLLIIDERLNHWLLLLLLKVLLILHAVNHWLLLVDAIHNILITLVTHR